MVVNEQTAMRISVVYRCVSLIAGTVASLPCEVFRYSGERAELARTHPAYWLLHNEPNPLMTANAFWKNYMWWALMRGNGYGLIDRARSGIPTALTLVPPTSVSTDFSQDRRRLIYQVRMESGEQRRFDQSDMMHFAFIGWDGKQGRAPLNAPARPSGLPRRLRNSTSVSFPGQRRRHQDGVSRQRQR